MVENFEFITGMVSVTGNDKIVLLVLLWLLEEGVFELTHEDISIYAGVSKRTAASSLQRWKEIGVIDWSQGQHCNNYMFKGFPEDLIMTEKNEKKKKLEGVINESLKKTKEIHSKKKKKLPSAKPFLADKKKTSRKNAEMVQLQKAYIELFKKKHDIADLPVWTKTDGRYARWFIDNYDGVDKAIQVMRYIFGHWDEYKRKWKIDDETEYPPIKILYAYTKHLKVKFSKMFGWRKEPDEVDDDDDSIEITGTFFNFEDEGEE